MADTAAPATQEAHPVKIRLHEAMRHIPTFDGKHFAELLCHGSLSLEVYSPKIADPQTAHSRDELYFVASGRGRFFDGATRHTFGPGDAFFVPAGTDHRFEDFTDDFVTWVVFFGPEGGEKGGTHAVA